MNLFSTCLEGLKARFPHVVTKQRADSVELAAMVMEKHHEKCSFFAKSFFSFYRLQSKIFVDMPARVEAKIGPRAGKIATVAAHFFSVVLLITPMLFLFSMARAALHSDQKMIDQVKDIKKTILSDSGKLNIQNFARNGQMLMKAADEVVRTRSVALTTFGAFLGLKTAAWRSTRVLKAKLPPKAARITRIALAALVGVIAFPFLGVIYALSHAFYAPKKEADIVAYTKTYEGIKDAMQVRRNTPSPVPISLHDGDEDALYT